MSLKLGNTDIAGTQVLYSTTGNNTDGAMTQNATTTELNNCDECDYNDITILEEINPDYNSTYPNSIFFEKKRINYGKNAIIL